MTMLNIKYSPYRYTGGGQISGKDGKQVAYLAGRMNGGEADTVGHLMAAAPDLYQSLYDIMEVIKRDDLIPFSVSYMRQARAALAKAKVD